MSQALTLCEYKYIPSKASLINARPGRPTPVCQAMRPEMIMGAAAADKGMCSATTAAALAHFGHLGSLAVATVAVAAISSTRL
jgi:hypothetical protein